MILVSKNWPQKRRHELDRIFHELAVGGVEEAALRNCSISRPPNPAVNSQPPRLPSIRYWTLDACRAVALRRRVRRSKFSQIA